MSTLDAELSGQHGIDPRDKIRVVLEECQQRFETIMSQIPGGIRDLGSGRAVDY